MKPILWILVIGAALYYFITKFTVSGSAAQSSGSGGGGLLGLLGFGAGSPAVSTSGDPAVHNIGSTLSAPAVGNASTVFVGAPAASVRGFSVTPHFAPLQSRVRSGAPMQVVGSGSTSISPVRQFSGAPIARPV